VGLTVGLIVRLDLGLNVGVNVGLNVGVNVGLNVGVNVGLRVGLRVGLNVGLIVGTSNDLSKKGCELKEANNVRVRIVVLHASGKYGFPTHISSGSRQTLPSSVILSTYGSMSSFVPNRLFSLA
jgi:hypothetical protein